MDHDVDPMIHRRVEHDGRTPGDVFDDPTGELARIVRIPASTDTSVARSGIVTVASVPGSLAFRWTTPASTNMVQKPILLRANTPTIVPPPRTRSPWPHCDSSEIESEDMGGKAKVAHGFDPVPNGVEGVIASR